MSIQFPTQQLHLTPLPYYSPCYCAECKRPLTESRILDENSAWCPNCKNIVDTTFFQVPAWVLGATLFIIANFQFGLC